MIRRVGDRAQPIAIARALAVLVFAGALYSLMNNPFNKVAAKAENSSSTEAVQTGHSWVGAAWDAIPWVILVFVLAFLIAAAVYQKRGV